MAKALTAEEKAIKAQAAIKAKAAKEAAKAAKLGDATVVAVVTADGSVIRKYSEKVHGENFAEFATEFASKEEGRTVIAGE